MTGVIERVSTAWTIDTVDVGERAQLAEMFGRCSVDTVVHRFFGLVRQFPPRYLDDALAGRPAHHDAAIARTSDGQVIGLASLATGGALPELGVLVEDAWQRHGVGTALVDTLLSRARSRGVTGVLASVLPGREGVLDGLDRRLPRHRVRHTGDATVHVYEL